MNRSRSQLVGLALLVVLTVLLTLQARWLGQLATAQGEQTRDMLDTAVARMVSDFQATLAEVEDDVVAAGGVVDLARSPIIANVLARDAAHPEPPPSPEFLANAADGRQWWVLLDVPALQTQVFPQLARRALGPDGLDTYRVAVLPLTPGLPALYRSHPDDPTADSMDGPPDASADLSLRPNRWIGVFRGEELRWTAAQDAPDDLARATTLPSSGPVFIADAEPEDRFMTFAAEPARWRIELHHRSGSLEGAFARARIQNLALGGGLLGLLLAGFAFLFKAEQRGRRLAEKELAFVAGISHELRTPLTVMRTAASNLERGAITEPARITEYGALIEREVARVSEMVERVLRFSEVGPATPVREPVQLALLVQEAVDRCRPWRDRKRYHVDVQIAPDAAVIDVDPSALTSLLHNLIENAIKYGDDDQTVRIVSRSGAADGAAGVMIQISDEGPGIPGKDQERVFEPFFRAPHLRGSNIPGNGLGLSVARDIARAHGGRLDLTPADDERAGATFSLFLPRDEPRS